MIIFVFYTRIICSSKLLDNRALVIK